MMQPSVILGFRRFRMAMAALSILVTSLGISAAPAGSAADSTFAVIVVFDPAAALAPGRGFFHRDDRATAEPDAWDYVDRGVAGTVQSLEVAHGFRSRHVFTHALRGFAAQLTAQQIQALQRDPRVARVELDGRVGILAQVTPWGITQIGADVSSTLAGNGAGSVSNVHVYILDTGIDAHRDLNVVQRVNFIDQMNRDCHGHGTHVAGTVAARDNTAGVVGVAPGAPLTGVKVLDCGGFGSVSAVVKGVDWVTANAIKPAVANMSLGGSVSDAMDEAVRNSVASGVFYAVAAGNSRADACRVSPARAGAGTSNGIMTVAATDSSNREASFSNFGNCVDIWAPGVSILSTWKAGGTHTISGTSMASPHVAGTAALYLSSHPSAVPGEVEVAIKATALATGTVSRDSRAVQLDNAGQF
jgi:subtilisin family serine protease